MHAIAILQIAVVYLALVDRCTIYAKRWSLVTHFVKQKRSRQQQKTIFRFVWWNSYWNMRRRFGEKTQKWSTQQLPSTVCPSTMSCHGGSPKRPLSSNFVRRIWTFPTRKWSEIHHLKFTRETIIENIRIDGCPHCIAPSAIRIWWKRQERDENSAKKENKFNGPASKNQKIVECADVRYRRGRRSTFTRFRT